jgi:protein-disulfide isomerase
VPDEIDLEVPAAAPGVPACKDPVFVLCTSRSGSTLLRFVLDAHPDLACPPELKTPNVLAQLARLWSATDALGGTAAGQGGAGISEAAAAGIRHTMDLMIGPYLARRGKRRYCDKNLGTEPHVETLLAVYPEAKFICLYRHPMDMIASGVEACPWGLNQYGFEPYVAHTPGNSVLALARYWADHAGAILAVEDKFPGQCHRVRYEDLVADPDAVAAGIFGFLGLPQVPGISARAFSRERERTGPGDFKIWNTSQITDDSVGRGWSVPADLIPAPLTETVNGLIDRLGYIRIDGNWGTVRKPGDLRLPAEGQASARKVAGPGSGQVPPGSLLVSERLQVGLRRIGDEFIGEWKPYSDGSFLMVALAPASTEDDVWWLVDLAARKVVSGSGTCSEDRGWTISAPAATWEQVIRGGLNLGIAFRRHGMRYRDKGGGGAGSIIADNRVSMMSDLLGIVTWNPHLADSPGPSPPPAAKDHQANEQPPDIGESKQAADDELPPWERDRQPAPQEADLDAVLWQTAPVEQTPGPPRMARISISPVFRRGDTGLPGALPARGNPGSHGPGPDAPGHPGSPGRAAPVILPDEAGAHSPPAESGAFTAPAPARKRPPAPSRSQRTAGRAAGRGPASARERLHLERSLRARRRRRFRVVTVSAIALVAAAVITSVALQGGGGSGVQVNAAQPAFGYSGPYAPVTLNADNSVTMAQPGVTQPVLDVYEDFQCSACRTFERGSGAAIQQLADEGRVKVVYYPFTIFSSQPQRASSIRAWAAARCVPAEIWARYHNSLYASQPPQTAADGFAVALLVQLGRSAGVTSPSFAQCVDSQQYAILDPPLSDQIMNSGVSSMLTLKLNGQVLDPRLTSSQLRQQIISAASGKTTV